MKLDRREFVLSAASLAAFPLVHRAVIPAASAADMSLLFHGDFNVNSFSEYAKYGTTSHMRLGTSGNSPTISTEKSRTATKSARIYLNRKTSGSSFRTEATGIGSKRSLEFRKTYWIGFSIYAPSNWAISSTHEILFQLHHVPSRWGNHLSFSPILSLGFKAKSDRWFLTQDYVQTPEGQQQQSDRKRAFAETRGQIAKGKWTDWVIEYRPDWRSRAAGGTGVTRIWCNGTNVINYSGPNCVNNTYGPYIKFGCYKSFWKNAGAHDVVSERLYYFDEVRVSRPNLGGYTDVTTRGTDSARSMLSEAIEAG